MQRKNLVQKIILMYFSDRHPHGSGLTVYRRLDFCPVTDYHTISYVVRFAYSVGNCK